MTHTLLAADRAVVAKASVGGEVELDYASTGVTWRLKCPASKALSAGA